MTIRKTTVAMLIVAMPASIALVGCEAIERETGFGQKTQIGAGAGAATGGVLAAIAGANPGWIAASAVLGGVAGGAIGEYLSRKDAEAAASNQYNALQNLGEGETKRWNNAETGRSGQTTVNRVYTRGDGTLCKDFTEVVETGERTFRESGTACKQPGGDWRVQSS